MPKSHTGAKNQTADNSKYTIFYLEKGFEGLFLECYRNPTKTSSYIEDHSEDSLTRDPRVSCVLIMHRSIDIC